MQRLQARPDEALEALEDERVDICIKISLLMESGDWDDAKLTALQERLTELENAILLRRRFNAKRP